MKLAIGSAGVLVVAFVVGVLMLGKSGPVPGRGSAMSTDSVAVDSDGPTISSKTSRLAGIQAEPALRESVSPPPGPADNPGEMLRVRVVDSRTSLPVPHVTVFMLCPDDASAGEVLAMPDRLGRLERLQQTASQALTDSSGVVALPWQWRRTLLVCDDASGVGFLLVEPVDYYREDVYDLRISTGRSLTVRIVDDHDMGVANVNCIAWISAIDGSRNATSSMRPLRTTDARGFLLLPDIKGFFETERAAGRAIAALRVAAALPGYATRGVHIHPESCGELTVRVHDHVAVAVSVFDSRGLPVEDGVDVTLRELGTTRDSPRLPALSKHGNSWIFPIVNRLRRYECQVVASGVEATQLVVPNVGLGTVPVNVFLPSSGVTVSGVLQPSNARRRMAGPCEWRALALDSSIASADGEGWTSQVDEDGGFSFVVDRQRLLKTARLRVRVSLDGLPAWGDIRCDPEVIANAQDVRFGCIVVDEPNSVMSGTVVEADGRQAIGDLYMLYARYFDGATWLSGAVEFGDGGEYRVFVPASAQRCEVRVQSSYYTSPSLIKRDQREFGLRQTIVLTPGIRVTCKVFGLDKGREAGPSQYLELCGANRAPERRTLGGRLVDGAYVAWDGLHPGIFSVSLVVGDRRSVVVDRIDVVASQRLVVDLSDAFSSLR